MNLSKRDTWDMLALVRIFCIMHYANMFFPSHCMKTIKERGLVLNLNGKSLVLVFVHGPVAQGKIRRLWWRINKHIAAAGMTWWECKWEWSRWLTRVVLLLLVSFCRKKYSAVMKIWDYTLTYFKTHYHGWGVVGILSGVEWEGWRWVVKEVVRHFWS